MDNTHSRDGFRIFRITQDSATHVQLSPDSTLLERATAACNEFMAFWQEYAVKPSDQGYNEYAMVLDGEGELIEYPVAIPVPLDISHPTKPSWMALAAMFIIPPEAVKS